MACVSACGQAELSDRKTLFGNAMPSAITDEDQAAILASFSQGLTVSGDGTTFEDPDCGNITPAIEVVDLNQDGRNEVFIAWGNICTSGMAGRSLSLFVNPDGKGYRSQLGVPAGGWRSIQSGSRGWPDLEISGPGFCHAIWAWQDDGYEFKCNRPESADGCAGRENICPTK